MVYPFMYGISLHTLSALCGCNEGNLGAVQSTLISLLYATNEPHHAKTGLKAGLTLSTILLTMPHREVPPNGVKHVVVVLADTSPAMPSFGMAVTKILMPVLA